MNKREKIIGVIFLIVAAVWALTVSSKGKGGPVSVSPPAGFQNKDAAGPGPEAPGTATPDVQRILDKVSFKSNPGPAPAVVLDPFRKFEAKELMDRKILDLSELKLKGILFEGEVPVALINDQILRQGEIVSGFKVIEIRKNEVVLSRGLEKYTLRLFEEP